MKSFSQFLSEEAFDRNPSIGFWRDHPSDHITVYHGTHERNVPHILKHGLTRKDPRTGMISVSHDPHTAHGYAAMSSSGGESHFRAAGGKAVHTPEHERSVIKMRIPREWAEEHMDHSLSGNSPEAKRRLSSREEHATWRRANPTLPDHSYYMGSELRFKREVPPEFIVGASKKKPK